MEKNIMKDSEERIAAEVTELSPDSMEEVSGGGLLDKTNKDTRFCKQQGHDWELIKREKGLIWGYNAYYKCRRCGAKKTDWE